MQIETFRIKIYFYFMIVRSENSSLSALYKTAFDKTGISYETE